VKRIKKIRRPTRFGCLTRVGPRISFSFSCLFFLFFLFFGNNQLSLVLMSPKIAKGKSEGSNKKKKLDSPV